ncbi:MAG TPA: NACHT domain-containing protein [Allosphingosinicella sp.]
MRLNIETLKLRKIEMAAPDSLLADAHVPGAALRNEAMSFLSQVYGQGKCEMRVAGKKVDAVFSVKDLGRDTTLLVECKDYRRRLTRDHVARVWSDYSGIVGLQDPCKLLIVSRNGLTTDAAAFVDEQPAIRHLTIWELENEVLGLLPYITSLRDSFSSDGLSQYYVEARAKSVWYETDGTRELSDHVDLLINSLRNWAADPCETAPVAILGGYGAGKTSFAKRLVSDLATQSIADPHVRRPILIKLGNIGRFASLDGLLGALFTSEFSVRGYSFSRFTDFNQRGRFVVVLDGFDEMKHAMKWGDFRLQLQELNQLVVPKSKVVLLGRPSAFLSDAEYNYALRGLRPISGDLLVSVPGWPSFQEFELQEFTIDEIESFVTRYVVHSASKPIVPEISAAEKAVCLRQIRAIVELDPELFSRPVHVKLLADIASSRSGDLSTLASNLSRWNLYEAFFALLIERENMKEARKELSDDTRFEFVRRIARWIWLEKDGASFFTPDELPESVLRALPDYGEDEDEGMLREALSGSFLDRKPGDIFYFPHRSFAEFLVAFGIFKEEPSGADHAQNNRIFSPGVYDFLSDKIGQFDGRPRIEAFSRVCCVVKVNYLRFLCEAVGSPYKAADSLLPGSHWKALLRSLGESFHPGPTALANAPGELSRSRPVEGALLVTAIAPGGFLRGGCTVNEARYAVRVAAALLTRLFDAIEPAQDDERLMLNQRESGELLDIARSALIGPRLRGDDLVFEFSWYGLRDYCHGVMIEVGLGIEDMMYEEIDAVDKHLWLSVDDVLEEVAPFVRGRATAFFKSKRRNLSEVVLFDLRPERPEW